jgi:hypothetical protein
VMLPLFYAYLSSVEISMLRSIPTHKRNDIRLSIFFPFEIDDGNTQTETMIDDGVIILIPMAMGAIRRADV